MPGLVVLRPGSSIQGWCGNRWKSVNCCVSKVRTFGHPSQVQTRTAFRFTAGCNVLSASRTAMADAKPEGVSAQPTTLAQPDWADAEQAVLQMTSPFNNGTQVRITFTSVRDPSSSAMFMDGAIRRSTTAEGTVMSVSVSDVQRGTIRRFYPIKWYLATSIILRSAVTASADSSDSLHDST